MTATQQVLVAAMPVAGRAVVQALVVQQAVAVQPVQRGVGPVAAVARRARQAVVVVAVVVAAAVVRVPVAAG